MPTVIDALIVTLGLETGDYERGTDKASESLRDFADSSGKAGRTIGAELGKTGEQFDTLQKRAGAATAGTTINLKRTADQATRTGKEMESRGAQAGSFFSQVKSEAMGLFAVLLGGKGLEATVVSTAASMRDLGQAAANIGVAAPDLSAFTMAIARNGGSADAAKASLQGLATALQDVKTTGGSPAFRAALATVNAKPTDSPIDIARDLSKYADTHSRQRVNQVGAQLGLSQDTINELAKGSARFAADMRESYRIGVPTDDMVKQGTAFSGALAKVQQDFKHLADEVSTDAEPTLTRWLGLVSQGIEDHPKLAHQIGDVTASVVAFASALSAIKLTAAGARLLGLPIPKGAGALVPLLAGVATDQLLRKEDPKDKIGTFIDRNVPGAAATDDFFARHLGVGRTYQQQAEADPTRPVPAELKRRQSEAMDFFVSQGWTAAQAAGIVGNLQRESGLDPTLPGDNGAAFGIAQWHKNRRDAIAAHFGIPVEKMTRQQQMAAVQWELTQGREKAAGTALRATTSAREAGFVVSDRYERPAYGFFEGRMRAANADAALDRYRRRFDGPLPAITIEGGGTLPSAAPEPALRPLVLTMPTARAPDQARPTPVRVDPYARMIADLQAGAARAAAGVTNHTTTDARSTSETVISGPISIVTQAKDAPGIARDLHGALKQRLQTAKANSGPA